MMKKISFLAFYCLLLFSPIALAQGGPTESSGNYQELMVALNRTNNTLSGYYQNSTGWDSEAERPRFNCIFYVWGKKQGDHYAIQTWFPGDAKATEVIAGELKFLNKEPGIKMPSVLLRLKQEHGGCWNVNPELAKPEGTELAAQDSTSWIEVRVVSANRAHFFQAPGSAPTKVYVVRGDGLGILQKKPGWVYAEYQKKTKGWVQESDLFPAAPPGLDHSH
jgi:hypothetical protein